MKKIKKQSGKNRKLVGNNSAPYSDFILPAVQEDLKKVYKTRISKIMAEFANGYSFVSGLKKTVTVFGSTTAATDSRHYREARKFGSLIAREGYAVITGGGSGIMEAANRGAMEAGGDSVGINIHLPAKQKMNDYVNKPIDFNYFFTRKVMLSFSSDYYIYFPGGFGTLDEFFEMATLVQTKKLGRPAAIIAVGRDYWTPLLGWVGKVAGREYRALKKEDLKLINVVGSAAAAVSLIKKMAARKKRVK